ncbi:MAG: SlyX family protein [Bacteriovoracaceae bacterium]|nr:SlyX family protein [Bacteriovoracaceae bacterium]
MSDLDNRVSDLEVKLSYQDELLNELNIIVADQQSKIGKMTQMLKNMSEQSTKGGSHNSSLEDERPPHY